MTVPRAAADPRSGSRRTPAPPGTRRRGSPSSSPPSSPTTSTLRVIGARIQMARSPPFTERPCLCFQSLKPPTCVAAGLWRQIKKALPSEQRWNLDRDSRKACQPFAFDRSRMARSISLRSAAQRSDALVAPELGEVCAAGTHEVVIGASAVVLDLGVVVVAEVEVARPRPVRRGELPTGRDTSWLAGLVHGATSS